MTINSGKFELEIQVRIHQIEPYRGGNIEISERHPISATDFLELAAILAKFHELAEKLAGDGR